MDNVDYKGLIFTVSQFKFWEILILKEKIYILDNKGHALAKHPPIWLFLEAGESQSWKPNKPLSAWNKGSWTQQQSSSEDHPVVCGNWNLARNCVSWHFNVPDSSGFLLYCCGIVCSLFQYCSLGKVVSSPLCNDFQDFKTEPWLQPHPSNCFRRPTASWTLMPNTVVDLIEVTVSEGDQIPAGSKKSFPRGVEAVIAV